MGSLRSPYPFHVATSLVRTIEVQLDALVFDDGRNGFAQFPQSTLRPIGVAKSSGLWIDGNLQRRHQFGDLGLIHCVAIYICLCDNTLLWASCVDRIRILSFGLGNGRTGQKAKNSGRPAQAGAQQKNCFGYCCCTATLPS